MYHWICRVSCLVLRKIELKRRFLGNVDMLSRDSAMAGSGSGLFQACARILSGLGPIFWQCCGDGPGTCVANLSSKGGRVLELVHTESLQQRTRTRPRDYQFLFPQRPKKTHSLIVTLTYTRRGLSCRLRSGKQDGARGGRYVFCRYRCLSPPRARVFDAFFCFCFALT